MRSNSYNYTDRLKYHVWQTSNKDSAYFKADTILMYNYVYAYFIIEGGQTVEWSIGKRLQVEFCEGYYDREPPMLSITMAYHR